MTSGILGGSDGRALPLPKKAKPRSSNKKKKDFDALRKALLSIGVDEGSAEKLLRSRALERTVVPIYWKDGLVFHVNSLWLPKLPSFRKSFEKEFPDGQLRWNPDYDEENPQGATSDVAIRVFFNYQEDDQGDHWSPKPTSIEEQNYYRMLKRYSYKGSSPVQTQAVLQGK
jgi:hypothetical protein